jgi:hypothetical protein
LCNFQLSLQITNLIKNENNENEIYITNIIKNIQNYTHKPLEIHILFYLIHNNLNTISYSFIEEVCEFFVKNLNILNLFSEKYKNAYKNSCIDFLKKYINKSKSEIIQNILEYYDKWDIYSFSMIYLHIIGNICRVFSLKDTFLNKIMISLLKNIHPDPMKRENLEDLMETYHLLKESQKDWSFVNNLDSSKTLQLFQNL